MDVSREVGKIVQDWNLFCVSFQLYTEGLPPMFSITSVVVVVFFNYALSSRPLRWWLVLCHLVFRQSPRNKARRKDEKQARKDGKSYANNAI